MRQTGGFTRCLVSGRVWHKDRRTARQALKRTARQAGEPVGALEVYKCPDCTGHHVRKRQAQAPALGEG